MCVTPLYACSLAACGGNNGDRGACLQACLYLICCCMQKVVCQTTMKVTSDGHTAALNYITLRGFLCVCETKHIHMNDTASRLQLRCLRRKACWTSVSLNFSPSRTISHPWYHPSSSSSHSPLHLHPHHSVSLWGTALWYLIQSALLTSGPG